ncbi:hypothetical protein D7Y13_19300 [Corallococcus praedator]|uniref:Lipoprotein n=2 Tax=Myxococcaceae TaxID=31 RepID=A0ABX9QFZ3_9BACT|nr:hypothetical protein D7Y13_19300 [Corallococcus praedator]
MWLGMMGLCTVASGCRESDSPDTVGVPATMQVRDTANGGLMVPATPALAQGTTEGVQPTPLPGANAQVPPNTAPPPGALPLRDTRTNAADRTAAQAPASGSSGTATNAPAYGGSGPAQAPARGGSGTAQAPAQGGAAAPDANATPGSQAAQANANGQPAAEGRVMIGAQAVQANDDESWYEGAAKAAQAAVTDNTADRPLEQVTIATSTVNGRVTRANRDTLHVRDSDGTVYELQLDPRSRGLRQGQRVPLPELREGTPVRASFALIGGRTVARDVQVRR